MDRKKIGFAAAAMLLAFLALWDSKTVAAGIQRGVFLCIQTIIPSLFLFMIVGEMVSALPLSGKRGWLSRLFGVSGSSESILLMGLIGGYPVGAKMISKKISGHHLSVSEGNRLLALSANASPAFLMGAVGNGVFHNETMGFFLIGCQLIALLFTGIILRVFLPLKRTAAKDVPKETSFSFVESVISAGKSLGVICFFVTVFSAFYQVLSEISGTHPWLGLLEVSVGCDRIQEYGFTQALFWCCLYLAFGGICVFTQLSAFLSGSGVTFGTFFLGRGIFFLFFYGSLRVVTFLFPSAAESFLSFSGDYMPVIGAPSPLVGVLLILLCLMLLITDKKYGTIFKNHR